MIGAIIGDIAGSTYEFHSIKTKDFPLFAPGSSYTDDSLMSIAVASALMQTGEGGDFRASVISSRRVRKKQGYQRPAQSADSLTARLKNSFLVSQSGARTAIM